MRQFRQRIRLVHELRQLARTEKFFQCRCDRTNIDQHLRRQIIDILRRHAFFNNTFHTGQTDAELVL